MSDSVVQSFLTKVWPNVSVAEFERVAAESYLFVKRLDGFVSRRLPRAENTDQCLDIVERSSWDAAAQGLRG